MGMGSPIISTLQTILLCGLLFWTHLLSESSIMLLALHLHLTADHIATVPRYNGTTYTGRVSGRSQTTFMLCGFIWTGSQAGQGMKTKCRNNLAQHIYIIPLIWFLGFPYLRGAWVSKYREWITKNLTRPVWILGCIPAISVGEKECHIGQLDFKF